MPPLLVFAYFFFRIYAFTPRHVTAVASRQGKAQYSRSGLLLNDTFNQFFFPTETTILLRSSRMGSYTNFKRPKSTPTKKLITKPVAQRSA